MSAYLASPVTLIVFFVIAVTAVIAIVLTVRSNHRKEREWQQEKRAMERRVAMAIEAELAGKEKARHAAPRMAKVKPQSHRQHRVSEPSPLRRSPGSVQRSEAIDDTTSALVATGILWDYDPPSRSHDSGSSHSSYDGGSSSSSSYDSGSSSSSSDSGSSGGGGGGGGE